MTRNENASLMEQLQQARVALQEQARLREELRQTRQALIAAQAQQAPAFPVIPANYYGMFQAPVFMHPNAVPQPDYGGPAEVPRGPGC